MCSCRGNETSAAKAPFPVTSGKSSSRRTERPTNVGFIGTVTRDSCPGRGAVPSTAPQTRDPEPQLWTPDLRGTRPSPSLRPHLGRRRAHCLDDVLIAGAAAQVRGQRFDQFRVADVGLALEHADGQHQKPRRAKAALQAVVLHERALQWMQRLAVGETLHGAGAAHPMLASDMRAGLTAIVADRVDQSTPRLDANDVPYSIDQQRDLHLFGHGFASAARSAARMRCGVAGISSIEIWNGESASLIALMIAAGAPIAPPSPSPLAPVMVSLLSVSR